MRAKNKPTYPLNQSPLFKLTTKRKLAPLLDLTIGQLQTILRTKVRYVEWDATNKNGKSRHIENPIPPLKRVQGRIAEFELVPGNRTGG